MIIEPVSQCVFDGRDFVEMTECLRVSDFANLVYTSMAGGKCQVVRDSSPPSHESPISYTAILSPNGLVSSTSTVPGRPSRQPSSRPVHVAARNRTANTPCFLRVGTVPNCVCAAYCGIPSTSVRGMRPARQSWRMVQTAVAACLDI